MKALVDAFNQEKAEGPSRGLLRDYEPSDGTFSSTNEDRDGPEVQLWVV